MPKTPFVKGSMLFSTKDHPGHCVTVCFTDVTECNLACYDCHNKYSCKKNYKSDFYSFKEFIQVVRNSVNMGTADVLVISGGEPTLFANELISTIGAIKEATDIPIRIDTNGQLPEQVEQLKPLVSGFAVDIKIPVKERYSKEDKDKFSEILGIDNIKDYRDNLLKTISIVDNMEYTIFRTVKYKQFDEQDKMKINSFVKDLNSPHYWNDFVAGDKL